MKKSNALMSIIPGRCKLTGFAIYWMLAKLIRRCLYLINPINWFCKPQPKENNDMDSLQALLNDLQPVLSTIAQRLSLQTDIEPESFTKELDLIKNKFNSTPKNAIGHEQQSEDLNHQLKSLLGSLNLNDLVSQFSHEFNVMPEIETEKPTDLVSQWGSFSNDNHQLSLNVDYLHDHVHQLMSAYEID